MESRTLNDSALFVGQVIRDTVAKVNDVPVDDQKEEAEEMFDQVGGNAPVAALTCASLGFKPHLASGVGNDIAGRMCEEVVRDAGVEWHPRTMNKTPTAIIHLNKNGRAITSPPEKNIVYAENSFLPHDVRGCRLVHVDGRQFDAALHYVKEARRLGIPTSIDAGKRRANIEQLLPYIDFAVVSLRFCKDMNREVDEMLFELRKRSRMAAVTLGAEGLRYSDDDGPPKNVRACKLTDGQIVDENGSGDIHNGARIFSQLTWPHRSWLWHFQFANAAAAWKIQRLGNAPPTLEQVYQTLHQYGMSVAA